MVAYRGFVCLDCWTEELSIISNRIKRLHATAGHSSTLQCDAVLLQQCHATELQSEGGGFGLPWPRQTAGIEQ